MVTYTSLAGRVETAFLMLPVDCKGKVRVSAKTLSSIRDTLQIRAGSCVKLG